MCKLVLNSELNGVELYFGQVKPAKEILTDLKLNGFRWNGKKICWYAKQNNDTLEIANKYSNSTVLEVAAVTPVKEVKNNTIDLWELTRVEKWNNDSSLKAREIAKEIRQHLKKRFPFVKFSIRTRRSGYSSAIDCDIVASPFEKNSSYLNAIQKYCQEYTNSYNWDESDIMTDYHHCNFYGGHFQTEWDYEVIEATEEIKNAMKNFDIKEAEAIELEKIEQEKKYQEYLLQCEEAEKQHKIRLERERQEKEVILNNIEVVEVEEEKQYYIINANFANLNKNNTLKQYEEEIKAGDYYKNTLKVTREIHFKSIAALKAYSNQLLNDFDFIDGTGGSYTEDKRINSMTDYNNMSEADRKTVEWILQGIAVYFENELQFVIDAQGYSYARYVGLIGADTKTVKEYEYKQVVNDEEIQELKKEAEEIVNIYNSIVVDMEQSMDHTIRKSIADTIRKNNLPFNKAIIQQVEESQEKIKHNLYRVLKENDSVLIQFSNCNLLEGEEITIIRESLIGGASISKAKFNNWEVEVNGIVMTIGVNGKRGLYQTTINGKDNVLIYRGHINNIDRILYEFSSDENFTSKATKYGSYDSQAFEDIITHLQEKNVLPIINTFRPVF